MSFRAVGEALIHQNTLSLRLMCVLPRMGMDLTAPLIALSIVKMLYSSSSILWPTTMSVFYTNGGADWKYRVVLSVIQGLVIDLQLPLVPCCCQYLDQARSDSCSGS